MSLNLKYFTLKELNFNETVKVSNKILNAFNFINYKSGAINIF